MCGGWAAWGDHVHSQPLCSLHSGAQHGDILEHLHFSGWVQSIFACMDRVSRVTEDDDVSLSKDRQ